MEELQPRILVRLDSTIARVGCQNVRTRELDRKLTILVTSYLSSSELSDKLSGLHCGKIIGLCRVLAYLQVEDSSLSHPSQVEGAFNTIYHGLCEDSCDPDFKRLGIED